MTLSFLKPTLVLWIAAAAMVMIQSPAANGFTTTLPLPAVATIKNQHRTNPSFGGPPNFLASNTFSIHSSKDYYYRSETTTSTCLRQHDSSSSSATTNGDDWMVNNNNNETAARTSDEDAEDADALFQERLEASEDVDAHVSSTKTAIITGSTASNTTTTTTFNGAGVPLVNASSELLDMLDRNPAARRLERLIRSHNLVKLVWYDTVEIYLLGTAHVSNDSVADAQALLQFVDPDVIMVELCWDRLCQMLSAPQVENATTTTNEEEDNSEVDDAMDSTATKTNRFRERLSALRGWRKNRKNSSLPTTMVWLMNTLAAIVEEYAEELGLEGGGEFKAAYEHWEQRISRQRPGSQRLFPRFVLGDRPFLITVLRAWKAMPWWSKAKAFLYFVLPTELLIGLVAGIVFGLAAGRTAGSLVGLAVWIFWLCKDEDNEVADVAKNDLVARGMTSFRRHFPALYETAVEERDTWMAVKTIQVCLDLVHDVPIQKRFRLVSIVGAGHVAGMLQRLMQYSSERVLSRAEVLEPLIQCEGVSAEEKEICVRSTGYVQWRGQE